MLNKEEIQKDLLELFYNNGIKEGEAIYLLEQVEKIIYNEANQLEPLVSLRATSAINLLDTINAYHEYSMREHCYKFSIKNIPCLIVTDETQEEAALKMVAEIQKHLSESN